MADPLKNDAQALRILHVLRRRWWIFVVIGITGAAAAYGLAKQKPKQFSATAALLFQDSQLDQQLFGNSVISSNADPTRQAQTNLALVELPTVARLTAHALNIPTSRVASEVTFGSNATSDVLGVNVTDRSPSLAARIANTYVQEYITFRQTSDQAQLTQAEQTVKSQLAAIPPNQRTSSLAQSLQSRSYQLGLLASLQTGNAEVVQTATAPSAPSSPNPPANAVIGLLLGLVFAGLLVFGFDRYDTRIKSLEDIEELFDAPVIGTVPESQMLRRAGSMGTAREQDAFRMVRAQLRYFDVDRDVRSVMITSANISEGKSTLALNLARASAAGIGHRTLLIDADLRRPSIARMLGVEGLVGLSELLTHSQDLTSGLRELVVSPTLEDEAAGANFDVLVAGSLPPNPAELLESQRMTELLAAAESAYDLVIVDTPPIGVVSDPIGLVRQVDGVVLVARLGRSRRDHALRLIKQLRGLNAHVLGVVVNGVAAPTGYSYGYAAYAEPVAEDGSRGRSRVRAGRSR